MNSDPSNINNTQTVEYLSKELLECKVSIEKLNSRVSNLSNLLVKLITNTN